MNGPLYANELFKISRLAYGNVTKLVDVEFEFRGEQLNSFQD